MRKPVTLSWYKFAAFCGLLALSVGSGWCQSSGGTNEGADFSALNAVPSLETAAKYQGKIVHDIEFRGIAGTNPEMLRTLLTQKAGEPLDRAKLRSSLETLYATGRFATLQVEAETNRQNQLILVFVATENYFNGAITVDGTPAKTGPKAHELIDATRLDLGEPFSNEKLDRGIDRMKKVMADNGYYLATMTYELRKHDDTRQVDIHFQVVPGVLARVGDVVIEGKTGIPPDQVRKLTKLKGGDAVKQGHVTRALDRLRKEYQKNQHLEAQVSLIERKYHPDTNRLDYTFQVEEGPVVAIITEGHQISKGDLKRLVPVYQENAVDDDLLNEGRRNLRDFLQTKGYFDAEVEVERQPLKDDRVDIVYEIHTGARHKLAAIKIQGNHYFFTDTIRERMTVQTSSVLLPNGRFSQRLLALDLLVIKNLYLANGFLDVKVTSRLDDNYEGQNDQIAITIQIEEGPQTLVQSVQLIGAHRLPPAMILNVAPGQPYSEANVADDRDAITLFYYNNGFPDVQFSAAATPEPNQPYRMKVVYTITEGQQVFVDRVLVSGVEYTRPYVVNRQMRIADGDSLSQNRMVASQRRLYDLGLFNQVDMAVQNPDGQEPSKDVLFNLQEAKRWTFRYGAGIEFATGNIPGTNNPQGSTGISPNGVLQITRLNMFGRDQTLTFQARVGLLTRRGLVSYEAPRLFSKENWRIIVSAFYDNTADVNTFASQRLEGALQAEQTYSRSTKFLYGLIFQRVSIDPNSLVIDPALIPLYTKPVFIAMPTFTWVRDRRDNAIDAHTGSYNAMNMGLATSALGSETNFGRVLFENSTYYTFKKKWVFARRTQIGIEHPYGTNNFINTSSLPPDIVPAEATEIPLPELFFAGGSTSLRSFSINQAGPRDQATGYPIGGQGLFVNNLEIRTPPVPLPYLGDNVGFVFFHDMGNVFDTASHIIDGMLRFHQASIATCSQPGSKTLCNFSYDPQAVGMGIRYKTPVGPVRFDLGYTLNPTRFPIQDQTRVDSLRRINVFFSIGQTF